MVRPSFEKVHDDKPLSLNVYLQSNLHEVLRQYAVDKGVSRSEVIRIALKEYFEKR